MKRNKWFYRLLPSWTDDHVPFFHFFSLWFAAPWRTRTQFQKRRHRSWNTCPRATITLKAPATLLSFSLSLSLSLFLLIFRSFSSFFFLILKENDFFFTRYRGRRGGGSKKKKRKIKTRVLSPLPEPMKSTFMTCPPSKFKKKNENIFHGRAESRKMRDPRTRVEAAWLINKQIVAKKRRRRKARERWSWVDLKKNQKEKEKRAKNSPR